MRAPSSLGVGGALPPVGIAWAGSLGGAVLGEKGAGSLRRGPWRTAPGGWGQPSPLLAREPQELPLVEVCRAPAGFPASGAQSLLPVLCTHSLLAPCTGQMSPSSAGLGPPVMPLVPSGHVLSASTPVTLGRGSSGQPTWGRVLLRSELRFLPVPSILACVQGLWDLGWGAGGIWSCHLPPVVGGGRASQHFLPGLWGPGGAWQGVSESRGHLFGS